MSCAIVFPGQGSQFLGMLSDLADPYPQVRTVFDQASEVLGFDLWHLVQDGPEQELNKTENTQPALLTAGIAIWQVWQDSGGDRPEFLAGHSLGEYTALVCAGALEFSDAVSLVADRGRYMQAAVPEGTGAMAAILGLDDDSIIELCHQVAGDQVVSAANFNSPGQVVIAGHTQAVEQVVAAARQAGARRAITLPVSVPSHCALMQEAASKLAQRLESVTARDASIPVIQNVDAELRTEIPDIKQALVQQLHFPVRWHESIQKLKAMGIRRIVECGPGKVLTGLCRKIDRELEAVAVNDKLSLQAAIAGVPS